jgi:hypothetical protein
MATGYPVFTKYQMNKFAERRLTAHICFAPSVASGFASFCLHLLQHNVIYARSIKQNSLT